MSLQNVTIKSKGVTPTGYHGQDIKARGTPQFIVSSSSLREFGVCASRWKDGYEPPDTEAKDWGALVDCLVLTPQEFTKRYAVQPPTYTSSDGKTAAWTNLSKTCRGWNEEQASAGREAIKGEHLENARAAANRLWNDEILCSFLTQSDKQVWLTGQWTDAATGLVIPVQCLIDVAPKPDSEFPSCLGDLKTTRSAAPFRWSRYSSERGYHVQAAFDLDLWNAATGEQRDTWCFLLSENFAPWQTGRVLLSQEKLGYGRMIYKGLLARYARCVASGVWPDYQIGDDLVQGWSIDHATKWDEAEAMRANLAPKPTEADLPPTNEEDLIP
jgi:hypothetical protein